MLVAAAEGDVRWAQNGMLTHCMSDRAWRDELTELEIYRMIARLTEAGFAENRTGGLGSRAGARDVP
jgi:hypothetical protein